MNKLHVVVATLAAWTSFSAARAQSADLAENNSAVWGTFASDQAVRSVQNSSERVKDGAASLLFTTQSGFDTGVRYPAAGRWNFDATAFNTLVFWEYPENNTPIGWQGDQPIVVVHTGSGTITLTPQGQLTPNFAWRLIKAPLNGGPGWNRTTTGTPNLADVDQIEIHHDTWDYGFRIWFDGVRFMNLQPNGLPPAGPPPPPGVEPDAIVAKVYLYIFNPIMENFGSRRMNQVYGWRDPVALVNDVIADFAASSHGRARYQVVETIIADEYPRFQDGFQHNDATFAQDWQNRVFHNSTFDYVRFCNDRNLGPRVDAGEIDEVWVYAPPIAGMWESCMAGRGAYWINGPTYPTAGRERAFVIMGWNFERGVGEAIHSWGHRAENIMAHSYGPAQPNRTTTWSAFSLQDRQSPGQGGVGNVHFPVNALSDYDYANARAVSSDADDWLNYPALTGQRRTLNSRAWSPFGSDPQREYLNWWYARMPHARGRTPDFFLANWWRYLIDVDQFKNSNGNLFLTIGIPTIRTTAPSDGLMTRGVVRIRAAAEVDGALGRVDLYVDGQYIASDTLAPYTFAWDSRGRPGPHLIVTKAYELQNGTEAVASPVTIVALCPADFDDGRGSGTPDNAIGVEDLLYYLDQYALGIPAADLDNGSGSGEPDGGVDLEDLLYYLARYAVGC